MSARQNKKRKGRNNVNNRERTVTTFTEDPNTSFLVPLPSEEPAGANLMSSPFSVASSSANTNNNTTNNSNFQLPANFGMSYNFHVAPVHGPNLHPQQQQQQQQQQFFSSSQVMLPPGKNDLEVLENLKTAIKEGQHEFYRAIPQPAALASLYLGPTAGHSQVPPHPEQHPADYYNHSGYDNSSDDQIPPYSSDSTRRPADPTVVKDSWKSSSTANISDPTSPPGGPKPGKKVEASPLKPESKISTGPDNVDVTARDGALGDHRDSSKNDPPRPVGDRPGEYPTRPPVDSSAPKSTYDGKDDLRTLDDRRSRFDAERNGSRPFENRPNGNDARLPPRDQAFLDKDRDRDREREREREREWGRDRDRSDRPQYGGRSYGRSHAPRPPPEQRHYEPRYPFDVTPRRFDAKDDLDADRRPPITRPDDRGPRPPIDDRRPPVDDRESRSIVVDDRDRPRRVSLDDRSSRPLAGSVHSSEDRTTRPPLSPDDRAARLPPADARPQLPADVDRPRPLEERISQQPVPSLQERLSQPGAPRAENRVTHQPSLEERLSNAPIVTSDRPLSDDRPARTSPQEPSRVLPLSDRPAAPADVRPRPPVNDNFARPATPPPRTGGYVAPPRAASVARDDLRGPKDSPPVARDARDLRARDLSRERSDVRPPYRSDLDRGFGDDRRPDAMDTRRYSPPPPSDVRGRSYYPPRSPPPRPDVPFDADSDRRFATADQRDSFDRRRDWYGAADDDKSRLPAWRPYDREPQRERYDRDAQLPRGSVWEGREPERRAPFSGSPVRPLDSSRPLSSRLGDGYPPPVDDRSYPPRDFDRPRYTGPDNDPPFVRGVRPRSPSPPRRGGANSSLDDIRPPLKRAREDPPYSGGGYYSPRRPPMADYPPRSAATPPPGSGTSGGFYESRGGPPPPFSSASAGVEREYPPRERPGDGPPYGAAYDRDTRPRSPPPRMYGRPAYRPDPRDDRRYLPPPPRSS
ncbi:hypothetical protein DFH29DRAFT_897926 [Suillus ampliporus]|nr:hypothetical protein DFH29DRAFT_897926 [Suillus ampliporus]